MRATGAFMLQTSSLSLLAEAKIFAGAPESEVLEIYDEALRTARDTSEGFSVSDLHRLRGELLLASSPERREEAEEDLRTALRVAIGQGAVSLESRARESLERAGVAYAGDPVA